MLFSGQREEEAKLCPPPPVGPLPGMAKPEGEVMGWGEVRQWLGLDCRQCGRDRL